MENNQIGLPNGSLTEVASNLNKLLASYQVFYMNTRGFHWNIAGEKFFELHVKFEELYNDLVIKIDEIAERILTISHTPLHSFTSYLDNSRIEPATNVSEGRKAMEHLLSGLKMLIAQEREVMAAAQAMDDEGTAAMMSDYIREQEKLVWMYSAWLK